ncbi:hypothetical protein [Haladaptatus sp. DFWS20]|uniref:hypothetical protein n=1 Tax=Haladaptatus sp. DFWS20 TaxID=3403467 RepID=UPI003EB99484
MLVSRTSTQQMADATTRISIDNRRQQLLDLYAKNAPDGFATPVESHSRAYLELPTLELRQKGNAVPPIEKDNFEMTIEHVQERRDCADFGLAALLRALYRYGNTPSKVVNGSTCRGVDEMLDSDIFSKIEEAVTGFAYWFDEPGEHEMWFSTENHQILFHTAELLAGQRFPDATFADGQTGAEHRNRATKRVNRWLGWRLRFGYSEWTSNVYYDEDLAALVNLADYAADPSIRNRSRALLDLTLFEIACNSYDGIFGSSHGRTYPQQVVAPETEPTSAVGFLCWGRGEPADGLSRSGVLLATSEYRVPAVIQTVARNDGPFEHYQRQGLDVADAPAYGLKPDSYEDQLFFWGSLVMGHRDVAPTALEHISSNYRLRYPEVEQPVRYHTESSTDSGYEPGPNNTALTQSVVATYRTSDYMLSAVQDFRKGKYGFQHHVWQATLGGRALVFTNHPKTDGEEAATGQYWGGTGLLPRAFSHRNVAVCCYRVGERPYVPPEIPGFDPELADVPYTHAYLPQTAFDDIVERNGWVFGRKDEGYLALTATAPTTWREPRDADRGTFPTVDAPYELVADAPRVAWVCELGRRVNYGEFEAFVDQIATARVGGENANIRYESPSVGRVEFGWKCSPHIDGEPIAFPDQHRFKNRYCTTTFDADRYEIQSEKDRLVVDVDE